MNKRPAHVIMVGPCRVAIFLNTVNKEKKRLKLPKVVLDTRYRSEGGKWRSTNSMTVNEIPKAILALEQSYAWLTDARNRP